MTRREILKSMIYLAIPTMIEEVLNTLLLYVDTAMVGHLGEKATAAVSCTTTVTWLASCVPHALSVIFLALISRECGANNKEKARHLSGQAFTMSMLAGIAMTMLCIGLSRYIPMWMHADKSIQSDAASYFAIISIAYTFRTLNICYGSSFRAVKDTKTPMVINLVENLLNVVLNALFIYGLHLGVRGAAAGSAISYTISGIIMVYYARKNDYLHFGISDLGIVKNSLKQCCEIGIPAFLTSAGSCLGYVFFAGMVSGMGTTIFAAHSIAVTAEELFYIPGYGLRMAASSLVGNAIGEGNMKKKSMTEQLGIILTVAMMVITGSVLYLTALPIMKMFTPVTEVAQLGAMVLRMVAVTEPFYGLMIAVEGIFYGSGRTKAVFVVEVFSMWCIRIVSTYLVTQIWHLGLKEVWYCMIADNLYKALGLFAIYLISVRRSKNS